MPYCIDWHAADLADMAADEAATRKEERLGRKLTRAELEEVYAIYGVSFGGGIPAPSAGPASVPDAFHAEAQRRLREDRAFDQAEAIHERMIADQAAREHGKTVAL